MARESRLPKGGENLFQEIKRVCLEAEAKGVKLFRLSIGQPTGPALLSAREGAAEAIMSDEESMHEYQDNGEPGVPGFSKAFVQANVGDFDLSSIDDIAYLPIPGIKPMLGLIPMACGEKVVVQTMTKPGYPTPGVWCDYLNLPNEPIYFASWSNFRFDPNRKVCSDVTNLLMLNYPHNPSGQIATKDWWNDLCIFCYRRGIRIFNDAAYAMLAHSSEACTLTEVAVGFPSLSWAEAFSASKMIGNGTGWRIGAMVGSPDFIGDIATIKGNTDSGFNAALATGVLRAIKEDIGTVRLVGLKYKERINRLMLLLTQRGMQLAVEPKAGFFTLWKCPKRAFGEEVRDAKHFNFMMIERTGIVGVHFDPYIRYAVVAPIENPEFMKAIKAAFDEAEVEY
ncbi:aminotransferase class I/II-fold pyridoxal phosphate-dependent enzyme [Patescibacteria group bacterium]|nr:aminotransferase class I/II-fold pyridoxal phosphate-dependent enzyme [Patescibacteria group bacterium]MBU2579847.1 aminotransferase class I/II-fold pyridoxal phosphate-dependent enzyme [Patescibacteria group bacterium]